MTFNKPPIVELDPAAVKQVYPDTWAPSDPPAVLKALFDRIQRDTGVDRSQWARLVDSYIVRNNIARGISNPNIVEERSSLNKKLKGNEGITYKTFTEGLLVHRVKRYRIGVTIESPNGTFTEHGVWVNLDPNIAFDPEMDKDIPIPREASLMEAVINENIARKTSNDYREPPPDLSEYAGTYPKP